MASTPVFDHTNRMIAITSPGTISHFDVEWNGPPGGASKKPRPLYPETS
ncbi:MAG: hypothetical protein IPL29_03825 [Propionivibrio sp.]|nr:hypothetical protein [Propionivibrio sp.]